MKESTTTCFGARVGTRVRWKWLAALTAGLLAAGVLAVDLPAQDASLGGRTRDRHNVPALPDNALALPCGPLSVHAVLEAMGYKQNLDELIEELGGYARERHSLDELNEALRRRGFGSDVVAVTPQEMRETLTSKGGLFIAAMKQGRNSPNHCVAVLCVSRGGRLTIYNPPARLMDMTPEQLAEGYLDYSIMVPPKGGGVPPSGRKVTAAVLFFVGLCLAVAAALPVVWNRLKRGGRCAGEIAPERL